MYCCKPSLARFTNIRWQPVPPILKLSIKELPSIYCDTFSDEIRYLMHICKAKIKMKHNVSVIPLKKEIRISKSRKECINRGKKNNLTIVKEPKFDAFGRPHFRYE